MKKLMTPLRVKNLNKKNKLISNNRSIVDKLTIDSKKNDWVVVGKVVKTYGTKGLVKFISYCDEPSSILSYEPVILESTKEKLYLDLNNRKNNPPQKKLFIAKISSSKNIETSLKLIGEKLLADKEKFNSCKKNDFFYSDLEGCSVLNLNYKLIGKISGVFNHGAGDLLEITKNIDNSTMLVTFNKNNFPKISVKEKFVITNITKVDF